MHYSGGARTTDIERILKQKECDIEGTHFNHPLYIIYNNIYKLCFALKGQTETIPRNDSTVTGSEPTRIDTEEI